MPEETCTPKYPLLEQILAIKGISLQPTYSNRDLAALFGVSVRAIQDRVASGQLTARNLPGRAKFLPLDLEEFLRNSKRKVGNEVPNSSPICAMSPTLARPGKNARMLRASSDSR